MTLYVGTNLKMNLTAAETAAFVAKVQSMAAPFLPQKAAVQLWIAPSHTNIAAAAGVATDPRLWIGSQNVHWEDAGAFTGEISPVQLRGCGASFVMLGHAERRRLFGETDDHLRLKVRACANHGLRIMLCVGESLEAKQAGAGRGLVESQLKIALSELKDPADLLILYEPVWSIGSAGSAADPGYVNVAMRWIRDCLAGLYAEAGRRVPILYGGSVTAENAGAYAALPGCSGIGVSRAAWKAEGFVEILRQCLRTMT